MMVKVTAIISKELDVQENKVVPDALFTDLGTDSLDVVELTMAIEDAFDIEIPDEDIVGIRRVKDVFDYLKEKI